MEGGVFTCPDCFPAAGSMLKTLQTPAVPCSGACGSCSCLVLDMRQARLLHLRRCLCWLLLKSWHHFLRS